MPIPAEVQTKRQLLAELMGNTCRCGAHKKSRHSFCGQCFYSLPNEVRTALYHRIGDGYEEAFFAACELLGLPLKEGESR